MEFAHIAEFRQNAKRVFDRLQRAREVVVTRKGRPIGLLLAADPSNLDTFRVAAQRARAQLAADRLRRAAGQRGLNRLPNQAIDELIQRTRRKRSARR